LARCFRETFDRNRDVPELQPAHQSSGAPDRRTGAHIMLIARGKGKIFHYEFIFAGQRFKGSTRTSSRTVAQRAEDERRREVEAGYNKNVREVRRNRVRNLEDIVEEYLEGYRVRYRSSTFAEYALGHVCRLLGKKMTVDINEAVVLRYQEDRLREKAAPKSINEEVRFLLKLVGSLQVI
jgi:hypothetical protein